MISFLMLGRCPLIMNSSSQSVVNYNISITGTLTALIMCSAGHQVYFECGRYGHWKADLTTICSHSRTSCKDIHGILKTSFIA